MSSTPSEATTLPAGGAEDSRYPWRLVGLLWGVAFVISAGRSTLIAVMPQLREEFALSATQLALINSASFWIYAIGAFLFGRLGDGTHRSRLIVGGLAFWSVATGLTSLSTAFALLIAMRGLVALGEATNILFQRHRAHQRLARRRDARSGVVQRIKRVSSAGAGIGALSAGLIADRFGWRMPFVILGSLGVVVCTALVRWLRDAPNRRARTRPADDAPAHGCNSRTILRRPAALYICAVFFLASGASAGPIVSRGPTFLHDELGLDLAGAALYGSVTINLAGFLFVPVGAFLAERLAARTPLALFYTLALGLALAAAVMLLAIALRTLRRWRSEACCWRRVPAKPCSTVASTRPCTTSYRPKRAPPRSG